MFSLWLVLAYFHLAIHEGELTNRHVHTAAFSYPAEAQLSMINLIKNPVLLILVFSLDHTTQMR